MATTQERIKIILQQKDYQISKGKVLRYDRFSDKFIPVPYQGNRIPLVKEGQVVEVFVWDEVKSVIDGLQSNGKPPEAVVDALPIRYVETPFVDKAPDFPFNSDVGSGAAKFITGIDPVDYAPTKTNDGIIVKNEGAKVKNISKSKSKKMSKEKKLKVAKKALKKIVPAFGTVKVKSRKLIKKKIAAPKKNVNGNHVSISEKDVEFITSEHKKGTSRMKIAKLLSAKKKQEVSRHLVMYHVNKISKK